MILQELIRHILQCRLLSSELGRSVTAEEIKAMSKSIALREQETPFGTIKYDFDEYKPE